MLQLAQQDHSGKLVILYDFHGSFASPFTSERGKNMLTIKPLQAVNVTPHYQLLKGELDQGGGGCNQM